MDAEQPSYQQPVAAPQGHSRLGIASLVIAVVTGLLYCLASVFMVGSIVAVIQNNDQLTQQMRSGDFGLIGSGFVVSVFLFGLCMVGSPVIALVGLGLGIGSFFQKDKQKLFPILGTVFNSLLLCGSGGFLLFNTASAIGQWFRF